MSMLIRLELVRPRIDRIKVSIPIKVPQLTQAQEDILWDEFTGWGQLVFALGIGTAAIIKTANELGVVNAISEMIK